MNRLEGWGLLALAVVCCACAAGCGGEGGTAAGGGSGFRAKVDGTPWVAESISIAAGPIKALPGSLLVVGSQNAAGKVTGLNLTLDNVTGPGPYALGVGSEVYGGIASIGETPTGTQASNVWETPLDGVSGQIVITTLTSDHLVATFAFVAAAGKKNLLGGMRTITDGQIDLPFSGALTPVPENVGSKVSATLNDVPYNAWLVSGMLKDFTGAAGVSISTASSVNALSLMLEGVTAPGVYALSDATPLRTIIIGKTGGDAAHCCWGLNGGGDVGTLTITSLTPARVKGTFTGTLQPQPGKPATTPLVVTDGAFDVGIP